MGIQEAISAATGRSRSESQSDREWRRLSEDDREAITSAVTSGVIGSGKLHEVLKAEGVRISKHFLDQLKSAQS